jgi:hypothetical protein
MRTILGFVVYYLGGFALAIIVGIGLFAGGALYLYQGAETPLQVLCGIGLVAIAIPIALFIQALCVWLAVIILTPGGHRHCSPHCA